MDGANAYGEIERESIEAAIRVNPYLRHLRTLFELLFKRFKGKMSYCDEEGKFVV